MTEIKILHLLHYLILIQFTIRLIVSLKLFLIWYMMNDNEFVSPFVSHLTIKV